MKKIITVKNLQKEFEADRVLQNITMDVHENEILVLLGPNGVGKTILLCCLTGGIMPSQGEVLINGKSPELMEIKKQISFLLQGSMVINFLNGKENIDYFTRLHEKSTDKWKELVKKFEIEDELTKIVKNYSGGMKRKIELIIALTMDTPILIFDEPTTGLDLSMIRVFHDLLLKEKDKGKTVILSTHNPINAEIADRIIFMRGTEAGSEIITSDTPQGLLDQVPRIIRLTASTAKINQRIENHLLGERLFEKGGESIGFISDDGSTLNQIKSIVADENPKCEVKMESPSYTDMFNYFTYIWQKE
ncbi:MAG: putative ABC-type transport system ATP-binding protein [Promethearchaeota archaeon]|nr:MAG: putative ABC-type transport system ATP-binding protein [Candidatus Lokiarchaeota archaeon]